MLGYVLICGELELVGGSQRVGKIGRRVEINSNHIPTGIGRLPSEEAHGGMLGNVFDGVDLPVGIPVRIGQSRLDLARYGIPATLTDGVLESGAAVCSPTEIKHKKDETEQGKEHQDELDKLHTPAPISVPAHD
jgi:hypothetical protein